MNRSTTVGIVALGLFASALGCSASQEPTAPEAAENVLVTSSTIGALQSGEMFPVQLDRRAIFHFDTNGVDFSRVNVEYGAGTSESMDGILANPLVVAQEPLSGYDGRLLLTGSAEDFGTLSPAQIAELEQNGTLLVEIESTSSEVKPLTVGKGKCKETDKYFVHCNVPQKKGAENVKMKCIHAKKKAKLDCG